MRPTIYLLSVGLVLVECAGQHRATQDITPREDVDTSAGPDEFGLDSLARLTLAMDLDQVGFPISEVEVDEAGGVDGLTRLLLGLS